MTDTQIKKHIRTHYKCICNPFKRKRFDFKKGKLIKVPEHNVCQNETWPLFGHICPVCGIVSNQAKHWIIDEMDMCDDCAMRHFTS